MKQIKADILKEIPVEDFKHLRDLYKSERRYAPHVYSFLKTAEKWALKKPESKYITIYSVDGDWETDGTFIAHEQFSCYDFFIFTLDRNCERLFRGITETRRFEWKRNHCLFYAVHQDHADAVQRAMDHLNVTVHYSSVTNLWRVREQQALEYQDRTVPDFLYLKDLKPEDAKTINEIWPPRYKGSEEYLRTFIEMNGGYGIYRKFDDELVSWVLKNPLGQLGVLQTKIGYMKMGLGLAVTLKLSKRIAMEGHDPVATIHDGNTPSEILFGKLGFEKLNYCYYIGVGKEMEEDEEVDRQEQED